LIDTGDWIAITFERDIMVTNEKYRVRLESERRSRGKRCHMCGIHVVRGEFAHKIHYETKEHQGLKGPGRGKNHRVIDILFHPDKYILLCHNCHIEYDHFMVRKEIT